MAIYMSSKICKTCKVEKQDEEFIKADGQHRSTRNRCKECHKQQSNIRKQLRKKTHHPMLENVQFAKNTQKIGYWIIVIMMVDSGGISVGIAILV